MSPEREGLGARLRQVHWDKLEGILGSEMTKGGRWRLLSTAIDVSP